MSAERSSVTSLTGTDIRWRLMSPEPLEQASLPEAQTHQMDAAVYSGPRLTNPARESLKARGSYDILNATECLLPWKDTLSPAKSHPPYTLGDQPLGRPIHGTNQDTAQSMEA